MPTSGTGSLETLTFRLKAARVGYSGAMHDGGQQKAHSIGGDMLLASLHQLAAVKAALPPYMRRFVSRAIRGAVAERNRDRPRLVDLQETFRITLYPVGSHRSLNPYPTCSEKSRGRGGQDPSF